MGEESSLKSCSALSKEQIRVNHAACESRELLHQSFMHGEHDALKEHLKNNPVHLIFDGSLKQGIELVMSRRRTMSEVAPTLIILLQNGAQWAHDYLLMPGMMTPCHVICRSTGDHQELLELLIKELGPISVNAKNDDECTALMYAVSNANIQCVKCLLANGADVNLMNDKPNVADMNTGVALIEAIKLLHSDSPHSLDIMMEIFDLLLDSGADVNKPCNYHNRTPIMYAVAVGNVNCVEKLIQKGAQVNYTDKRDQTVWAEAARAGNVDVLKCLIEDNDIDKNSIDARGFSVLCWAVIKYKIEAVRYLLKQGATITSFVPEEWVEACKDCGAILPCYYVDATEDQTNPYMLAVRFDWLEIVKLLDEYGCDLYKSPEILSFAIRHDSVGVVKYLLCNYEYQLNYGYKSKNMYDDSYITSKHQTFLIEGFETHSVEAVKLLLEHGASISKMCYAEKCLNIIYNSIYEDPVEIIACFIRGGFNMNTKSDYPNLSLVSGLADIGVMLPFEAAVWADYIYTAELLLVTGCSRGIPSWNHNHPLNGIISSEMQELLKEWNVHKNNVIPLQQRCRMAILNHLYCVGRKIAELPLPPPLIKYLSIPELDDIIEKHWSAKH